MSKLSIIAATIVSMSIGQSVELYVESVGNTYDPMHTYLATVSIGTPV